LDRGEVEPGLGAGDRGLKVFGEAAVAVEPGEGALDQPTAGEGFQALGLGGALDDLDRPAAEFGSARRRLSPAWALSATRWRSHGNRS